MKSQVTTGRSITPVPNYILSDQDNSTITAPKDSDFSLEVIIELQNSVNTLKSKLGSTHQSVSVAIVSLARAYYDREDYDNAYRHFKDALLMKRKTLQKHHPSIADTLRSLGETKKKLNDIKQSEKYYIDALSVYRRAFEERNWISPKVQDSKNQIDYDLHQMMSRVLVHLGTINYEQEDYKTALNYYEDARREAKMSAIDAVVLDRNYKNQETSRLKESRLFISAIINNIANVYSRTNKIPMAIQTYNDALNLQIQEVGEDHFSVSCTLHNMGTMYYHNGEFPLSLKCYKQVLKMRRGLVGTEHPSIADALINIAIVHGKEGEFDRAESALKATLRVVNKVYDDNDFRVAFLEDCLGMLNAKNGLDIDALVCFSKALTIYKDASLSDNHPFVKSTKKSIEHVMNKDTNKASLIDMEEEDDIMDSLLSCGGYWFSSSSSSDLNPNKTVPLLV